MSDAPFNYINDLRKQLANMPPEPEVVTLTLLIPSKRHLESGAANFSSWPQLAQAYAAFPTGTSSTAEKMTPTFLRAVADLVDRIQNERDQRHGTSRHAQQEEAQGSPSSTQAVTDMFDQLSVLENSASHDKSKQKVEMKLEPFPHVSAAPVSSAPGGPSASLGTNPFIPPPTAHPSYHHDKYYTPNQSGAAFPPSSKSHGPSASLPSVPTTYPTTAPPPHHSGSSPRTPVLFGAVHPGPQPSIRPSQAADPEERVPPSYQRLSIFEDHMPPGRQQLPAMSSPQTGWGRVTGSQASGNAFSRSGQAPASSFVPGTSGGMRSSVSGSVQGGGRLGRAASVGSQGGWSSGARSSATIPGRRRMGVRNTTRPAGGNRRSSDGIDLMDCE